jgi:hypothetical protein
MFNKRDTLQKVLTEYGFSEWYVVEPSKLNPTHCLLFNPKERKMAEVSVPDKWLDDPRRYSVIGELLALTIDNCSYALHVTQRS